MLCVIDPDGRGPARSAHHAGLAHALHGAPGLERGAARVAHVELEQHIGRVNFLQDNESKSVFGVLRGLHYQQGEYSQAKLVRVIKGTVLDVAVDLRTASPTFGKHISVELSEDNKRQLFIPRGFAHGFLVLSDEAIFTYKVDNYYTPQAEATIMYNDPQLKIDWPVDPSVLIVSDKDKCGTLFAEVATKSLF